MKKITTIITIIASIVILIFIGSSFYSTYKHDKEISNLPDYYQQLALECETKGSYSCCIASVNDMSNGNYKLASGDTLVESGCPDGFQENMLKCIDSFRWCEPEEIIEPDTTICKTNNDCPENYSCKCTGIVPLCPTCEGGECIYTCEKNK